MKTWKSYITMALLLSFMLVLSACSGSSEESKDAAPKEEKEAATRTVQHAMGETEVPENPERVVILTNEGTEALLSMDVKPVGAVQSWTGEPWYKHIEDKMTDVEVVGTESEPNIEKIASLKPDLIIGNKLRQEKVYEQLNAIAPTVFSETLKGEWQENFKLYADALNKQDKGQEVLDEYNARIESFKEQAGEKLDQKVSVVRFLSGDVRIYQKDSFSGVILEQLGFQRPASQDVDAFAEKNVTKERIPDMDGDILFYFTYETGDGEASQVEKEWTNDPLWQKLNAVQQGNVHRVSDATWNTSGGVLAANEMLDDLEKIILEEQ
ncbi:iron-siderophore ABC transporter substrate-binding protein [Bacillus tianshenii]|nr:iron-siderophore ABC transporter substrate-binding protein [Bacillus tianshenii]